MREASFTGEIYRVAKTHKVPKVAGYFSQKSHELQGSFVGNEV